MKEVVRDRVLIVIILAVMVATGTWFVGWWTVPILAGIAGGLWWDHEHVARDVALGAAVGWALLLAYAASSGRIVALARALGGVLYLPWPLLMLVALAFPAGLAWSATTIAATVARFATTRRAA
jgi:Na+/citrate or Na+/malate symporter